MPGFIADFRRIRGRRLAGVLAAFFGAALLWIVADGQSQDTAQDASTPWFNPEYIVVDGQAAGAAVTLGGTVVPDQEVTLTAQLAGQVIYLGAREGDRFDRSTVLVEIQADELYARRRAVQAQLDVARADIRNSDIQYERELFSPRSRSLNQSGGMGAPSLFDMFVTRPFANSLPGDVGGDSYLERRADLYLAGSAREQAQARYRQIVSQIDEIDAMLADAMVFTPFPGIVLERMIEEGDIVYPGTPLMRYANDDALLIEARVPAGLVDSLSVGQSVAATISGNTPVTVQVERIYPMADARLRTVTVEFRLPASVQALPGTYAELTLDAASDSAELQPTIPLSAIRFNGSLPTVRVLDGNNKPSLRMIRIGEKLANGNVIVLSGLSIGERVLAYH